MIKKYGKQFAKILSFLKTEFIPVMEKAQVSTPAVERLKLFIENWEQGKLEVMEEAQMFG